MLNGAVGHFIGDEQKKKSRTVWSSSQEVKPSENAKLIFFSLYIFPFIFIICFKRTDRLVRNRLSKVTVYIRCATETCSHLKKKKKC